MQEGYPITPCRVLRWPQGDRGTGLCFGPQLSCPGVQGSFGSWGGASCLAQHHSDEGVLPRSLVSQALVSVLLSKNTRPGGTRAPQSLLLALTMWGGGMPGFQVTHRGGTAPPHPTGAPHIHLKFLWTGARLPHPAGAGLCPGSPATWHLVSICQAPGPRASPPLIQGPGSQMPCLCHLNKPWGLHINELNRLCLGGTTTP